jgi:flagellar hook-associated protein 3 FlgL
MYGMRIPNNTLLGDLQDAIQDNRTEYSKLQLNIATGKKYLNRSDNAIETNEAATIKNYNTRLGQWEKNVESVANWEKATDGSLQSILSLLQRANEVAVQANDGTTADSIENLANEVDSIIESLVQTGNSKYNGKYLFEGVGGTNMTGVDPFAVTRNAEGQITAVTYEGSSTQRTVQTSDTETATYGLVGVGTASPSANQDKGIFKFTSLEDVAGVWTEVEVNTFDNLVRWRDALEDGDLTDMEEITERVQRSLDHVIGKVIENASSQQKFDNYLDNLSTLEASQTNRLSDVEDLDVTAAITNLTTMQANLQASLQMVTRMNAMSIVNFI